MPTWQPAFFLPNISVEEPIGCDAIAIASCEDERARQILDETPALQQMSVNFTDPFGRKLKPSMLIFSKQAPKRLRNLDAVASFRDLVAMSIVPPSRAQSMNHGHSFATYYSDFYDFYPWTINAQHNLLVCTTPALGGFHDPDLFKGQCTPGLSPVVIQARDIDKTLLDALIKRWLSGFGKTAWPDVALFRSLEMAVAASKMPAGADVTLHSLGRSVALWVSAFEILAHPEAASSDLNEVYKLLEKTPWNSRSQGRRRFKAYVTGKMIQQKISSRKSLACWLYGEIYQARNDFLHGNRVRRNRLNVKKSGKNLFGYAPLLYRMALAAFLPLPGPLKRPAHTDIQAFSDWQRAEFDRSYHQGEIERALRTVRVRSKH